jgi:hypothetical protein
MRACFLGPNICNLGYGVATLRTPPLVMDQPVEDRRRRTRQDESRTEASTCHPLSLCNKFRHGCMPDRNRCDCQPASDVTNFDALIGRGSPPQGTNRRPLVRRGTNTDIGVNSDSPVTVFYLRF